MKKTILMALAMLPLAAFAQGPGGMGHRGMGHGQGMGPGQDRGDPARMERRMRLARTLGLAEALDLDATQALKLGEAVAKYDERRLTAHKQLHDAHMALRKAATGEKVTAAEVDQAIQKSNEARAQIQAVDREIVATVTKDLAPEKKARAVLFLEKFQSRFGPMGGGKMKIIHKRMMGPGGMGPGGPGGMGPSGMGPDMEMRMEMMAGPCAGPDCDMDDDAEE